VIELPIRCFLVLQGVYGTLLERAQSEQGVSTIEYALLVALIAFVAAAIVAVLGSGIKGVFGNAHTCVSGLNTTTCKVGPLLRRSTDVKGP